MSRVSSFSNIPTFINLVHCSLRKRGSRNKERLNCLNRQATQAMNIVGPVAGKICIHFSQLSETTALCWKNISIRPDAQDIVLCSKLCRHKPTARGRTFYLVKAEHSIRWNKKGARKGGKICQLSLPLAARKDSPFNHLNKVSFLKFIS